MFEYHSKKLHVNHFCEFKGLTPMSDQDGTSHNTITITSRQVMGIKKNINNELEFYWLI